MGSGVVQVVGTSRAIGAALVAAGLVLAGCTSDDGDDGPTTTTTTSPAVAEASGSPWDLPLEQRPALFDPCEEIPIEAVEAAVGSELEPVDSLEKNDPGDLISCGWKNKEIRFGFLSTWKSRDQYLEDASFALRERDALIGERVGLKLSESVDSFDSTCVMLFFTTEGTVWANLDLVGGLNTFKGQNFTEACDAIDVAILPILQFIPEGEFS